MLSKVQKTIFVLIVTSILYSGFTTLLNGDDTEFFMGIGLVFLFPVIVWYLIKLWTKGESK